MSGPVAEPSDDLPVVRRESGDIVVGTLPAAPAGVITLPLPGATAYLDPTSPDGWPAVVVSDEREAAEVLDRLYGDEAGIRIAAASEVGTRLAAVRTEATGRLIHFGLLRWLRSTGTLPLDRATLAFESAVARDDVADLVHDEVGDEPDVEDLAPLTVALARSLRQTGDDAAWAGLPGLLDEALAAIRGRMLRDDPMLETVEHEAELRAAMRAYRTGPLDWDRWEGLMTGARPEAAAHAGPLEVARGRAGRSTVDWAHVPPGVLDTAEGTITWQILPSADGSLQIRVEVLAHREPAAPWGLGRLINGEAEAAAVLVRLRDRDVAPGLRFRVYVPGFPLPLATAPLVPTPGGHYWSGSVDVPSRAIGDDGILVDVQGAGLRPRPQFGSSGVRAEATRWAARGLSLLRLSLAAGDGLRPGVREPWERARQLYASVADTDSPDAQLAVRQGARCTAVLLASLEAAGETRTRHLHAELTDLAEHTRPQDIHVPDLSDPAWTPTVTELGLLATPGDR